MTSTIPHSSTSAQIRPSQNTAPVVEFRCLYTHDVRRKAKRWRDGFLKYHTFNKRIMVYDEERNHIGDSHWQESEPLREGDEVALQDGVLVEVAEALKTTQTDLSQVIQKKKPKESLKRRPNDTRAFDTPYSTVVERPSLTPSQPRHRSLNALLGTRKGPLGKATVSTKSPFEERHGVGEGQSETAGAEKRQNTTDEAQYNVVRTSKPTNKTTAKRATVGNRSKASKSNKKERPGPSQGRLKVKEIVDITSSIPCGSTPGVHPPVASSLRGCVDTQPLASQSADVRPQSPPVSASNRISLPDESPRLPPNRHLQRRSSPQADSRKKVLRIGARTRTKLLSYEDPPPPRARPHNPRADGSTHVVEHESPSLQPSSPDAEMASGPDRVETDDSNSLTVKPNNSVAPERMSRQARRRQQPDEVVEVPILEDIEGCSPSDLANVPFDSDMPSSSGDRQPLQPLEPGRNAHPSSRTVAPSSTKHEPVECRDPFEMMDMPAERERNRTVLARTTRQRPLPQSISSSNMDRKSAVIVPPEAAAANPSSRLFRRSRSDVDPPTPKASYMATPAEFQRSFSLNALEGGRQDGALLPLTTHEVDSGFPKSGPWTVEAFDLLDWRPPWFKEEPVAQGD